MKCPNCQAHISSINEISNIKQTKLGDKRWYKLHDEDPITCSKCNTELYVKASKEIKVGIVVSLMLFIALLLVSFYYSTALFIGSVLLVAISAAPLFNYIIHKYGKLHENNT